MKTYYVDGKEVTALDKAKHKVKQLEEATELLEEFSDRLAWAEDFAEYPSIIQALDSVYTVVEQAKSELEDSGAEIEEQIQEMLDKKKDTEAELFRSFEQRIAHCLA